MIDCNVYVLEDKNNKAVKVGITKKHPTVRLAEINKQSEKYKFNIVHAVSMPIAKARYIESRLLDDMDNLCTNWVDDDSFGGYTETAIFEDIGTVVEFMCFKLDKLNSEYFEDALYQEVQNSANSLIIPEQILGAKYLYNTATQQSYLFDCMHKIVYLVLKKNTSAEQSLIADLCGISRRSVIRVIQHLQTVGIVSVHKDRSTNGANYNTYVVKEIDGILFSVYK